MRKVATLAAALLLALTLSACGAQPADTQQPATPPTDTEVPTPEEEELDLPPIPADLTGGKPWIDSVVEGNVTADTKTSPTDDFYTWVNKDWCVSSHIPEGSTTLEADLFAASKAKVLKALQGEPLEDHDARQAQLLFNAFIDTDARDAAGCTPAKKVIDEIRSIKSVDELSAFLLDTQRSAGVPTLIEVRNKEDWDTGRWLTRVSLSSSTFGSTVGTAGVVDAEAVDPQSDVYQARYALVHQVLTRSGYSDEEAKQTFEACLDFEREIIRAAKEAAQDDQNMFTLAELEDMVKAFPLRELIETRGYAAAKEFEVLDTSELRAAGTLYTEDHLEGLRAYLTCGYALEAGAWLDTEAFDAWRRDYDANGQHISLVMPERNNTIEETALNLEMEMFPTPLGRVYTEAYDLARIKEVVLPLCKEAVETHKEIVNGSEWLSDATKQKLCAKLDAVTVKAVYPDVWEDYSSLELEGLGYYEARREIWLNNISRNASYTGKDVDRRMWDTPALINGAGAYDAYTNSFYAEACYFEDEVLRYEAGEITYEELLGGKTGYIIFHELGHALDTKNIYIDATGQYVEESLLTPDELEEYNRRTGMVESRLSSISIWEGQQVPGNVCMNEAVAEISGMRARLVHAAKQKTFDYRKFFETRAALSRVLHTPEHELMYVLGLDMHPTSYIDINLTFQQFDEFAQTYGVKEGDAMYVAPEDRLILW